MLSNAKVTANIPASDLTRARAFYADKLGLTPSTELGGEELIYETSGGTVFSIYETSFAGQAGHTIAQWHVDDIEAEVRDLKAKGVVFEQYDMPGVEWNDGVASGRHGTLREVQGQRGQHPLHPRGPPRSLTAVGGEDASWQSRGHSEWV